MNLHVKPRLSDILILYVYLVPYVEVLAFMFSIKPKCKQILYQAKANAMHPVWNKAFNQIELLEEHKYTCTFNSFHLKFSKCKGA